MMLAADSLGVQLGVLGLLALLVLESMMQYTSSLLERGPRRRVDPLSVEELRQALQGVGGADAEVVFDPDGSGRVVWQLVGDARQRDAARVKLTTTYKAALLLDATAREARWFESIRGSSVFVGFDGWMPRFNPQLWYFAGYVNVTWRGQAVELLPGFPPRIVRATEFEIDTVATKELIAEAVRDAGWRFRPVLLPLYVSPRWLGLNDLLLPAWLRRLPRRQLWGVVYPLSYVLFAGWAVIGLGATGRHNLLVILLVSALWWGVWGLLTWVLTGTPGLPQPPRRRLRRQAKRRAAAARRPRGSRSGRR